MNAYKIETILSEDGILTLKGLPFHAGDAVEVIILERSRSVSERESASISFRESPSQPETAGFNILVGTSIDPIAYVNVKTTEAQQPMFYFSEGERQFSIDHAERFILLVVYAVHVGTEEYQLICHEGKICSSKIELVPMQWKARLLLG